MSAVHAKGIQHLSLRSCNVLLAPADDGPRGGYTAKGNSLEHPGRRGIVAQVTDFGLRSLKRTAAAAALAGKKPKTKKPLDETMIPYLAPEVLARLTAAVSCCAVGASCLFSKSIFFSKL